MELYLKFIMHTTCISHGFIRPNIDLINRTNLKLPIITVFLFFSSFQISDYRVLRILNDGLKMHSLELTDSGQQNQHVLAQENEYIIMAAT